MTAGPGVRSLRDGGEAQAAALAEVLEASTDVVGLVEAAGEHRIVYLNSAAQRLAGSAAYLDRPLSEVFARVSSSPLRDLLDRAASTGLPQHLRGVATRGETRWNLDAVPAADGLILVSGRPVTIDQAARQRLELLLDATEDIWRSQDRGELSQLVVDSAARLLPGLPCSLSVLERRSEEDRLLIIAGSEPWLCVGTEVPIKGSFSGRALRERRPVEGAVRRADARHRDVLASNGVALMRVIPLLGSQPVGDGPPAIGVISFMSRSATPFDEDDRRLMDEFGRRASLALHRSQLLERERRNAERTQAAFDTAMALSSSLSPRAVVDALLERAVLALRADRATLSSIEENRLRIEATHGRNTTESEWIGRSYDLEALERQPLTRLALQTGRPVLGTTYDLAEAAPEFVPALSVTRYTATLPLQRGGRVTSLLVVSRVEEPPFDSDDLLTLQLIGQAALVALHNARLYEETLAAHAATDRLARALQVGVETALDLGSELELSEVVTRLLTRAAELADADRCVLLSVSDQDLVVEGSVSRPDVGQPIPPGLRMPVVDQALALEAITTGVARQDSKVAIERLPESLRGDLSRLRWFASVPLHFHRHALGLLNLSRFRNEPFTEDQLSALTLLGQVAALAIRNARLFDELKAASQAKSDFLNLAAHELRTPISVLRGYLSMLLDGSLERHPDSKGVLRVLADKAADLNRIVDDLLSAARVQAGALGTRAEAFDLVEELSAAVDRARLKAGLDGGKIDFTPPPAAVAVYADRTQTARILDNLLGNAVTYSTRPATVSVRVRADADKARVTVEDRGRGIPLDERERIFEQFARVEDPARGYPPGTGLGLYISRGLARENGGEVRLVKSRPGQGSTFELELRPAPEGPRSA